MELSWGNFTGIFTWVKEFFKEGEAGFLSVIKSDQKLNYKKASSTESKEQHQNLNGQKLSNISKGFPPPHDLALYSKVLTCCPNSLRTPPETQWPFNKNNKLFLICNHLL